MKNGLLSAALLAFAAAASAAPPLSIPIPRPTPEQEERMRIEAEQAEYLESLEAAADAASAAETADADTAAVPEVPEGPPPPLPPPPDASLLPPPPPPDAAPADETPAPGPAAETKPPSAAEAAEGGTPAPDAAPPANPPAVFRRDPFWTVDVARARKADHDAAVAAKAEAEKRQAAIEKARAEAAAKGLDVENLDEDELADLVDGGSGLPRPDKAKGKGPSFGDASDAEWEAAFAKIPPRSGYFGGKKPALVLKGIKKPFFEGDELCVTNRGVVFVWRVADVDFRAYTHELERVKAFPAQ